MSFRSSIAPNIFLIDGLGAILSAIGLGLVLPALLDRPAISLEWIRILAFIAIGFSIYSLSCFTLKAPVRSPWLIIIIILNSGYAGLTLGLLLKNIDSVKLLEAVYFIGEIIILMVIVFVEISILRTNHQPQ